MAFCQTDKLLKDGEGLRIRPLTINDLIKDYDAVMDSVEHLKGLLEPASDWPVELTLEEPTFPAIWPGYQRQ